MNGLVDLTGKRILVVGASSGIGRQTAIRLNELGADVIMLARREEKLREVCDSLCTGNNSYYAVDLRDLESIELVFKQIQKEQGKLDGMVYSAGITMHMPLYLYTPQKLNEIFTINFFAFVECVRQSCKRNRYNEGMRIVGISSVASMQGDKARLGYSASKAAMDSAVRCIAKEVADKKICINTVAPAMTATDMYASFVQDYGENSESQTDLLKRQYLGIADPIDIANAVAFLMSPAARFITGITLPVDGGFTTS